MWQAHLRGEKTSLNPLSMMEALIGAIKHSVKLSQNQYQAKEIIEFANKLQKAIYSQMTTNGKATRDLSGPSGLCTEDFVVAVKDRIDEVGSEKHVPVKGEDAAELKDVEPIDVEKVRTFFNEIDVDKDRTICIKEFTRALKLLQITPKKIDQILKDTLKAF